jgi:hypothetical protein
MDELQINGKQLLEHMDKDSKTQYLMDKLREDIDKNRIELQKIQSKIWELKEQRDILLKLKLSK